VTLFAGFASTIFLPLAGWLVQRQGWRDALVSLGLVLAAGTVLPHALLLRRRPEDVGLAVDGDSASTLGHDVTPSTPTLELAVGAALRTPSFRWIVIAFCLNAGVAAAVRVNLVAYLGIRGFSVTAAATLAGSIGAMQVLGRILLGGLSERVSSRSAAIVALSVMPLSLLLLVLAPVPFGVFSYIVLFGASVGATTLVRPAFIAGLYGRTNYASIAGVVAFTTTLMIAASPITAGILYDHLGSYDPVFLLAAALSAASAFALFQIS
jgi:predicted MFS family arabinose efflux permease